MDCPFCNKTKLKNEILCSGEHFFLAAALGSFVPYYILLVSHQHICATSLALRNKQVNKEFHALKKKAEQFIREKTGADKIVCFEHGADQASHAGCCVGHMHLHILPARGALLPVVKKQLGKPEEIKNYSDLFKMYTDDLDNYLLLEEKERVYIWREPKILNQYMRRLVVKQQKNGERYDWKKHPYYQNMEKTISEWRAKYHQR